MNLFLDDGEKQREKKNDAECDEEQLFGKHVGLVDKTAKDDKSNTENACQYPQDQFGILQLVENGLYKREEIVECPVEDKSRRGGLEEEEEEQSHSVKLDLALERKALEVDHTGNDVDQCHENGEHVECDAADDQQSVGSCKILDRA